MTGATDVKSMASGLQSSIDAAMKRLQTQAKEQAETTAAPNGKVEEFQQDVKKSSYNHSAFATDVGVLTKDVSRLNVMSNLAAGDPADFYKVRITADGATTLGQVGDPGVRFQLTDKSGAVLADSDEQAGAAYDAYKKLQSGEYQATAGDYTIRISRAAGEKAGEAKNYAFQLLQGGYTRDYDTVARQPTTGAGKNGAPSYLDILRGGATSSNLSLLGGGNALNLLNGAGTSSSITRGSLFSALI